MKRNSKTILAVSLLFAFGGWLVTLGGWSWAELTPAMIGGLIMNLAAVVAAASGDSIIKPNNK